MIGNKATTLQYLTTYAQGRIGAVARRMERAEWILVSDIDGTLIGGPNPRLGELKSWLAEHRDGVVFGTASGRNLESTWQAVEENRLLEPEVMICQVGTEIYYGPDAVPDRGWQHHIAHKWDRSRIADFLRGEVGAWLQEDEFQTSFKVSYYVGTNFNAETLAAIRRELSDLGLRANIVFSHHKYLDFLPYRANKGKAIRYLAKRWGVPFPRFVTCGNSGNDADMLKGDLRGIVVGDHSPELESLRGAHDVFFADSPLAGGILEGLAYYGLSVRREAAISLG